MFKSCPGFIKVNGSIPSGQAISWDIEVRGLFLLDPVFEDADSFGLQNLNSKHLG